MGTLDWTRSFADAGPLQTVGLTGVLLPVTPDFNAEFGVARGLNAAGRLSLLLADTDIDFVVAGGDSRSWRVGGSMARNLLPELVAYGEVAWLSEENRLLVDPLTGRALRLGEAALSAVAGLRWQAPTDTTVLLEYYRNGPGVTAQQFADAVRLIDAAADAQALDGGSGPALAARQVAARVTRSYQRPQPLRDYVYLRVSQREPRNILYTTPAISFIVDPVGGSASVTPEIVYTGFTNTELRLRTQVNVGATDTDFGSRQVNARVELRARVFF